MQTNEQVRKKHRENYALSNGAYLQANKKWKVEHPGKEYEAGINWIVRNRHKKRAQMIAHRLIPLKPVCEICGGIDRLQRHHKDYGKPLEVLTLCNPCHNALEVIEPAKYSNLPQLRFYNGVIPVEILDSTCVGTGKKWPCKILATGEVKALHVGRLCYLPKRRLERQKTTEP